MKKKVLLFIFSLFCFIPKVFAQQYDYYVDCRYIGISANQAEYNPQSGDRCIPAGAYILGTYLYSNIEELSAINMNTAYKSIYNFDFYDVYFKRSDGRWFPQFGSSEYSHPYYKDDISDETVCVTHVDGVMLPDATCPEVGSGGGGTTPSGEVVIVKFYYVNSNGQIQQIGGQQRIAKDTYLNVAVVPDTNNYNKRGYKIDGWFNVPDINAYTDSLSNNKFNFNATVTSNLNLFIRYVPVSYKITYDFNGGNINGATSYENNSVICNPSDQFSDNCITNEVTPTRDGYIFKGWGIEKDGNTDQVLVGANENVFDIIMPNASGETNITLYAIWELYNYKITYYLNGGDLLSGQLEAYFNVENSVNLANSSVSPTRTGYSFAGWYADADLTQAITSTAGRTSNISVYAKWTPKSSTIRYYETGTFPAATQTCVYDDCKVDRANPTKAGYEFLYWLGSDGYVYKKDEKVVTTSTTLNLTAQFNDGNYYDISYDMSGGGIIGGASVSKYQFSNGVVVNLPTPSKPGYSFNKWELTSDSVGGGTITNKTRLTINRSGNIEVSPVFNQLSYTVTYKYYLNDQLKTETKQCTYDSCAAPVVDALYNGLSIKYWNGNDSKQYTPGAPIVHLENDLVLEAVYDSVSGYNIKFYDGNEQLSNGFINRYSSDYALHLPVISKTGYEFVGWKDKGQVSNDPNYGTFLNIGTHGDKELEAIWNPIKVTVKYDLNYAGAPSQSDKECYLYNADCTIGVTPSARSGYEFLGWSLNDSTSQLLTASSNLYNMLAGTNVVRLHAIWRPVQYSVIYDLNGGAFADNDLDDITYFVNLDNKNISMKVPTRDGYTFRQWSPQNATVADNTHATMDAAGNVTLEALWNPATLTVVFKNGDTTVNGSVSSQCNYEGCTINTDNPSRDGYVFKYWKTEDGRYIFNKGDSIVGFYGTLTLNAVFNDEDTNSITYDLNGGSFGDLNPIEEYVTGVGANLPVPAKDGFTFSGWAKVVNGNQSSDLITEIPNTATGDYSLKAVYAVKNYNVKIISHLGTQNNSVAFNNRFTMPAAPTAPDVYHTFAGWREAVPNGGTVNPGTNVLVTSDRTYYATWNVTTKFSIGYDLDGGVFGTGVDHPYSYAINQANVHIGNPEKDGYRFSGWRETNNYATINSSGILTVDTKADLEFKASWTQTRFNITYNYDGGTVASANPSTFTLDDRNSATVQLTAPTKDGYAFEGWTVEGANASVRGNTISIVPRANTPQTDLVVTATWRQVRYNITYDYAGGSITGTNPTSYEYNNGIGEVIIIAPTKEYYDFARWESSVDNISVGSNGVMILDGQPSDVKFTAVYTPKEYTITFADNTSRPSVTYGTQTCKFGTLCDIEMAAPSKEDRDFKYWKSSIGTIYPADGKIFAVSDMELEAEWSSPYTYSITYNLNHGEFIGDVVREYNHGEK